MRNGQFVGNGPVLRNKVSCYKVREDLREKFDDNLTSGIDEGILMPVPEGEEVRSLIPLMAVDPANN